MFQVLRIRDFRWQLIGGLVSSLGTWLLTVAVPAHVYAVTGSLSRTGLTLAAEYLPVLLLGPVAGALTDRLDRRRLMIGASLGQAAVVALMLAGLAPGRYWVFYAALAAESAGSLVYAPAISARIPAIVGTGDMLTSANALYVIGGGMVRLAGGPAGGILLAAIGIRALIGADALSYLACAGAIWMTAPTAGWLPGQPASRRDGGRPAGRQRDRRAGARPGGSGTGPGWPGRGAVASAGRDLRAGMRALAGSPAARVLLPVTVLFLGANAAMSAVLIPFGVTRLGGTRPVGFLLAALGAGFLISGPVVRVSLSRLPLRGLLTAGLAGQAAGYLLLFHSGSLAAALPAAALVGLAGSAVLTMAQTTMQRAVPNEALGRVSAVFLTAEAAVTLGGALGGPFAAQAFGLPVLAATASLVTLAAAAVLALLPPAGVPPGHAATAADSPRGGPGPVR